MKRLVTTAGILAGTIGLVGLAAFADSPTHDSMKESRAYLHSFNLPSSGVALEGYCPVAYFAVNKPVRGKSENASSNSG